MRKICLSFILTFFYVFVFAQSYIDVKRDSLTLKGEVIINNATKNIPGYLYNTGNGVTKFVASKLSDTNYFYKGVIPGLETTSKNFLYPKNIYDTVVFGGYNNVMSSPFNVLSNAHFLRSVGIGTPPDNNYALILNKGMYIGGVLYEGQYANYPSFQTGWYINFRDSILGNFTDIQSRLYQSDCNVFYSNNVTAFNSNIRWSGVNCGAGYLRQGIGFNAEIDTRYFGNIKRYYAFHAAGNDAIDLVNDNDYYAALEADSVVRTTTVYGVNQHGRNAINKFDGSRFLLPNLPVSDDNGYKLNWNTSDGSVFISTDKNNYGSVSFSGDGSTTVFTVSHNLGRKPNQVIFQPTSSDSADKFFITNKTIASFDIVFKTAPPAGTNNLQGDFILK